MYELQLQERIMGYSASAARSEEMAKVHVSGVSSTEDGDLHINYLEGHPHTILSQVAPEMSPSEVRTMVVLISKDLKAKVYINELEVHGMAIAKSQKIKKGQALTKDDIHGFERIKLGDIKLPKDHAYFCVLSAGWDRFYIFDYSPLDVNEERFIEYDVEKAIGSFYTYLTFKKFHKIGSEAWKGFLKENWFPFSALKVKTIESMIDYVKNGWSIDELIETINSDLLEFLEGRLPKWIESEEINAYAQFLQIALDRHKNDDYVSSASILYPQIEGLIRKNLIKANPTAQGRKQGVLVEHLTESTLKKLTSLTTFFPEKFKDYLEENYFKDFTPSNLDNDISRHSVAHAASSVDKYDKKASLLGLLIFCQIAEYLQFSSNK
jgi:hypothetical protein